MTAPNPPSTRPEDELLLLVPTPVDAPAGRPQFVVGGRSWTLTATSLSAGLEYVCVSYAWGLGAAPHPFELEHRVSDRLIEVAETVIAALDPPALWIDGLCVPQTEPGRSQCLAQMGMIFSRAAQTIGVLSAACEPALGQVRTGGRIDEDALVALEGDPWVTRAWTYQEIVNSQAVCFVTAGGAPTPTPGQEVLQAVAYAIDDLQKARGIDGFEFRRRYPRLSALQDLIVDWKTAEYTERSAYRVMSCMNDRDATRSDDMFWAMMGAVTKAPPPTTNAVATPPAEMFMQACEANGDFSFIYTTGPRDERTGRRWRPVPAGRFYPVLAWTQFGAGQTGQLTPDHLQLDRMWIAQPGSVDLAKLQTTLRRLGPAPAATTPGDVRAQLLDRLQRVGWRGSDLSVELNSGYFFPVDGTLLAENFVVAIATGVSLTIGAPGLLLRPEPGGEYACLGVGLFVGRVPKTDASVRVT